MGDRSERVYNSSKPGRTIIMHPSMKNKGQTVEKLKQISGSRGGEQSCSGYISAILRQLVEIVTQRHHPLDGCKYQDDHDEMNPATDTL